MLIQYLVERAKRCTADALSLIRLLGAVAFAVLVLMGLYPAALVVLVIAALTEPLDGVAARRWTPQARFFPFAGGSGKTTNEIATGALCVLAPGAYLLRLVLAEVNDWSDAGTGMLVFWCVLSVLFVGATLYMNAAREQLVPDLAEKVEVSQGYLAAFLILELAYSVALSAGLNLAVIWLVSVVILLPITILHSRAGERTEERQSGVYQGTKRRLRDVRLV